MTGTADFQALARIYASEQVDGMVGSVLGRYRAHTGQFPNELAEWLGIDLPALAALSHEARPKIIGIDRVFRPEHGLAQLADGYRIDCRRLVEAFNLGHPDGQHACEQCTR
jgi:hypothetical protein